jgi:hypothetical protein
MVHEKDLVGKKIKQVKVKPMRGRRLRAARKYTALQKGMR